MQVNTLLHRKGSKEQGPAAAPVCPTACLPACWPAHLASRAPPPPPPHLQRRCCSRLHRLHDRQRHDVLHKRQALPRDVQPLHSREHEAAVGRLPHVAAAPCTPGGLHALLMQRHGAGHHRQAGRQPGRMWAGGLTTWPACWPGLGVTSRPPRTRQPSPATMTGRRS